MSLIKRFRYYFLIISIILPSCLSAQSISQSIIAAGGDFFLDNGYTLSSTIGEIMTESFSTPGNTLTQGFQQTDGYFIQVQELHYNSNITVYPNPFREALFVSFNNPSDQACQIELIDLIGRTYLQPGTGTRLENGIQTIDTRNLAAGIYFIHVSNEKNEILAKFKIIRL